jgi:hypothetical protein
MESPAPFSERPYETDPGKQTIEDRLFNAIYETWGDPLEFVCYVFPWGEPGGPLADQKGPDKWQVQVLDAIRDGLITPGEAIQIAVASGHGIGKSCLVAWIILWFMSTRRNPQIVVTANTGTQLETKTWRELAKWHQMAMNRHWFKHTATRFYAVEAKETWFAAAIPWSKERSEAFAGTHDENVLVIFDEASAIDDIIWEVAEGAMTTPGAVWIAFGNPTKNTGRFKECFPGGKFRKRWRTFQIDSRTAKMADRKKIDEWISDYGLDSDFVRVRVRGVFPRAGNMQFIGEDLVAAAASRTYGAREIRLSPIIVSVDVARFGDDMSVILVRQGLLVRRIIKYRGVDTMTLAQLTIEAKDEYQADAMFVDEVGIGAGVVDRLRQLNQDVIGVNAGNASSEPKRFKNKRMEMWWKTREWLKAGGAIPDDPDMKADLTGPEYGYTGAESVMQLEKKKDMKARGLASPDCGDALANSFYVPVAPRFEVGDYDHEWKQRVRQGVNSGRDPHTGY